MQTHASEPRTPASAAIAFIAVMFFGGAWGLQHIVVNRATGFDVHPEFYWLVYGAIGLAGLVGLAWSYHLLKLRIAQMLAKRNVRAHLSGTEMARQYLYRKETRERIRPVNGFGGPVPQRWKDYLKRNAQ
ncbi:MAG: hypothetical protein KDB82_15040 [Planctomycetes bacterium]|nr:hypothetical protein [Planctomycetota bacterium]